MPMLKTPVPASSTGNRLNERNLSLNPLLQLPHMHRGREQIRSTAVVRHQKQAPHDCTQETC